MANFMTMAALLKKLIFMTKFKSKAFLPLRTPGASPQARY